MAAHSSIYRCDIMNLFFFLGYLYFCIVINAIECTDEMDMYLETSGEVPDFENCTQCIIKPGPSCICLEYTVEKFCLICCSNIPQCCYCKDCTMCWHTEWQLMTMTHISISILFVLGIIGLVIIYCKICNRTRIVRTRCVTTQQERNTATHCSTIEGLRERPPSYSEVCGAPPLYASPYNRTSMREAPPTYPGTPKPQERSRDANEISPSIAQHM